MPGGRIGRDQGQQLLRLREMLRRREIDAVRVGLEDRAAVLGELVDEPLQQLASPARDLGRQLAVAEARAGKAEVAVERVDENLEAGLPRLVLGAQLLGRGGAGELLVAAAGSRAAACSSGMKTPSVSFRGLRPMASSRLG